MVLRLISRLYCVMYNIFIILVFCVQPIGERARRLSGAPSSSLQSSSAASLSSVFVPLRTRQGLLIPTGTHTYIYTHAYIYIDIFILFSSYYSRLSAPQQVRVFAVFGAQQQVFRLHKSSSPPSPLLTPRHTAVVFLYHICDLSQVGGT